MTAVATDLSFFGPSILTNLAAELVAGCYMALTRWVGAFLWFTGHGILLDCVAQA
jgi:hypothetical protein